MAIPDRRRFRGVIFPFILLIKYINKTEKRAPRKEKKERN